MFYKQISEDALVIGAPAKINLFLEVLGKRDDGYHDINSLFQAVSLFDRMQFFRTSSPGITIDIEGSPDLPTDDSNLIAKAYNLVKEQLTPKFGLRVHLEKNIPVAAGLAGGSSDAAATLVACNILFGLGLSRAELSELGLQIGSDIPFFFSSGQAMVSGRGEIIEEVEIPINYWLILVTPSFGISSAESYAGLRIDLTKPKNPFRLRRCHTTVELVDSIRAVGNDFEEVHFLSYRELDRIKNGLYDTGAMLARLTGSGPTMFGLFAEAPEIEHRDVFSQGDWRINTVMPISLRTNDQLDVGGNRGDY